MEERGSVRVRRDNGWRIERYPQTIPGAKDGDSDLRHRIVKRALDIAVRDGLDAVTIDEIAAAENVAPTDVIDRFRSRDGVMLALLDAVLARTLDAERDLRPAQTDRPKIGEMLIAEMEGLRRQAPVVELIFMFYFARGDDIFRSRIREALANYRRAFESALDESDLRRGVDASVISSIVIAFLQGAAVQIIRDPENFTPNDAIAAVRALLP